MIITYYVIIFLLLLISIRELRIYNVNTIIKVDEPSLQGRLLISCRELPRWLWKAYNVKTLLDAKALCQSTSTLKLRICMAWYRKVHSMCPWQSTYEQPERNHSYVR